MYEPGLCGYKNFDHQIKKKTVWNKQNGLKLRIGNVAAYFIHKSFMLIVAQTLIFNSKNFNLLFMIYLFFVNYFQYKFKSRS